MKKLKMLIGSFLVIILFSCESDNSNITSTSSNSFLKKIIVHDLGTPVIDSELFYNSDNRVVKIEYPEGDIIRLVTYENNIVTKIKDSLSETIQEEYNVQYNNNTILMTSLSSDRTIEIDYTNEYIDAYRISYLYQTTSTERLIEREHTFIRNENNNIITRTVIGDFINSSVNRTVNYSNFDNRNCILDIDSINMNLLQIFKLKISKSNPLTIVYVDNLNSSPNPNVYNAIYEYDQNNNVIISGNSSSGSYIEYEYIEL